jgi:hypothetical protein
MDAVPRKASIGSGRRIVSIYLLQRSLLINCYSLLLAGLLAGICIPRNETTAAASGSDRLPRLGFAPHALAGTGQR